MIPLDYLVVLVIAFAVGYLLGWWERRWLRGIDERD